jgi:hypothetical protein
MGKRQKLKNVVVEVQRKSATIYDMRAKELPANAQVAPIEVDDPYEHGAKIIAFRSIRDDPLGRLHAHGHIQDHQWEAGKWWRDAYEIAEIGGCRSIDPGKEAVDGGRIPEPFTDRQARAFKVLDDGRKALGREREQLIREVLGNRRFLNQLAFGERARAELARLFKECLEILAVVYGFTVRSNYRTISG